MLKIMLWGSRPGWLCDEVMVLLSYGYYIGGDLVCDWGMDVEEGGIKNISINI